MVKLALQPGASVARIAREHDINEMCIRDRQSPGDPVAENETITRAQCEESGCEAISR